ncbi:hypothetical protein [Halorubrum depositum]|uniref:hypothetical protein n=1 Tax=Halorubrum depositum TaxID=2583992 RepID=UPI0019D63132|nr:hypothetical protein [Halorubrum depositum]
MAKLTKIKGQLESLEDEFDFSFDGDFKAQLDDIAKTLDGLGDSLVDDLDEVADRLEGLEIGVEAPVGGGDSGGDTGSDSGDRYTPDSSGATMGMREIMRRVRGGDFGTTADDVASADLGFEIERRERIEGLKEAMSDSIGDGLISGFLTRQGNWAGYTSDRSMGIPAMLEGKGVTPDRLRFGKLGKATQRLSGRVSNLRGVIRSAIPSMAKWWQLIALAIPALITFGTQAAGVGAAMLSVAAAGAAFIGLGLIGHGNDMAESWRNAQEQLSDLKEDLYETFQPSMQTFAPIQDAWFDILPQKLSVVNDELKQLQGTSLQYALFDATGGTANFLAEFIRRMREMDGIIAQLAMRFGDIIGTNILDFFSWLTREAYLNQETLIRLGQVILMVIEIIYNLSTVFSQLIIVFSPLIGFVLWLTRTFESRLARAIISVLVVVGVFVGLLIKTIAVMAKLRIALLIMSITGSGAMASFAGTALTALSTIQAKVWATIASLTALQAALIATGIGALLVGGGLLAYQALKPKGPPSGGDDYSGYTGRGYGNTVINEGDTYNFNVDGSTDGPTTQKMLDVAKLNNQTDSTRSLSLNDGEGT